MTPPSTTTSRAAAPPGADRALAPDLPPDLAPDLARGAVLRRRAEVLLRRPTDGPARG